GATLIQSKDNNPDCSPTRLSDCSVRDVNGVELYFSPYDGLNMKTITVSPSYNGSIKALNIGTARSKKDVMAVMHKYWRFDRNQKFWCEHYQTYNEVKSEDLICVAHIGSGKDQDKSSIILTFNNKDRLISASVRASDYID
ncbi:MAG: hypothetical protein ACRCY3_13355, partial [Sphingorhabdus sp.]